MRSKWSVGLAAVALSAVFSSTSEAQSLRGFVRMAGDFGGDPVLQFEYSDGSSPDLQAGRGLMLTAGAGLRVSSFDLLVGGGIKYTTIPPAANQEASWMRYPVEGLLLYRMPFGLGIGAGATVHLGNVMEATGGVANARVEVENKPGYLFHAQWGRGRWVVDLRYTAMTYEVASGGTGTVNASSIGGGLSFMLGGK